MLLHTIIDWKESWFTWFIFTEKIQNFLQHFAVVTTDVKLSSMFSISGFDLKYVAFWFLLSFDVLHHL